VLVQDDNLVRLLKDFDHPEFEKVVARHSCRVTIVHRIIHLGYGDLPRSRTRLVLHAHLLPQSCVGHVRSTIFRIVGIFVRAICLDSFPDASRIPNPGDVTFWSGSRLQFLVVRRRRLGCIPFFILPLICVRLTGRLTRPARCRCLRR
jgi:hypothetical protein